jgi:hypothetical protein
MSEHRNSLRPGHRIQWYLVREVLGQGGFGITYLAEDTNLNLQVAIKEYLPAEMAVREGDASVHPLTGEHGEQFRWGLERFISEAQTLARFKHPNIVRVFTVFTANNTAYMVMEYEQGRSLAEVLKDRRTLPEPELRAMLLPLLGGLEQVHARGFIHRDIKPANIFLRGDGSPVLLDFGSARQSLGERTRTLTAMVSPGFAPFEQYAGKGERQGPWTDIYGLGATLYRAAVGRAPADAMDRSEALLRTSRDIFVGATEINPPGYSPALLRAIDRALAFRIEDRPAAIADWRRELGEAVSGEEATVAAAPGANAADSAPTAATVKITINADEVPAAAPPRRGRRWVAGAAVAVIVLVVLLSAIGKRRERMQQAVAPIAADAAGAEETGASAPLAPAVLAAPPADAGASGTAAVLRETAARTPPAAESGSAAKTDAAVPVAAPQRVSGSQVREPARPAAAAIAPRAQLAKLQEKLRNDPRNPEIRRELRQSIDEYERLARQAVRAGDYDTAETYLVEMLKIAPGNRKLTRALEDVRNLKGGKPLRRREDD